jgi:hypothetical protein
VRGLSGRAGRELGDHQVEHPAAGSGDRDRAGRGPRGHDLEEQDRGTETAAERALGREPQQRPGGTLTREQIAASPELTKAYAAEYRDTLRLVPDRELARDVARVNLTAKEHGEPALITREVAERLGPAGLRDAIEKNAADIPKLRAGLSPVRLFIARTIEPSPGFGFDR